MGKITPYSPNLQISPLSSLNFEQQWRQPFQIQADYLQQFARYDRIRVQYAASGNFRFNVRLLNLDTGQESAPTPAPIGKIGERQIYEVLLDSLAPGHYSFQFRTRMVSDQLVAAAEFCVLDEAPGDTVKITYNHRRSELDTLFDEDRVFDFRVEGLFLPSEASFMVESEGFRDQRYIYRQLSAQPYRKDILSIGGGFGVPNWVGEKLNYIFSLSFVMVDGEKYARSEGSTPEPTVIHADYPLFLYKIELEKDRHYTFEGISGGDFNFDYNQDYKTFRYEI